MTQKESRKSEARNRKQMTEKISTRSATRVMFFSGISELLYQPGICNKGSEAMR